ncbi:hypothetical protein M9Y10_021757 [Tritrichomonas musculus]|uniref:Uncharacterized protein n=1 Tax=Tritrichomonas musculus TaxID=1915356 RepID=A0ABR2KQB8_9EUKA
MLFLFLSIFSRSFDQCPPGINHIYNTAANVTINSDDGWYYFYSEYISFGDKLTVRLNPSRTSNLYIGDGLLCPTQQDQSKLTANQGQFSSTEFSVSGNPGLSIFGIHAEKGTNVIVSVMGGNPNKTDNVAWLKLSIVFLILCFVLLIMLFVHAILARGRVHYQVEVEE